MGSPQNTENPLENIPTEKVDLIEKKKDPKDEALEKAIRDIKSNYGVDLEPAKSGKYKIEKVMKYINVHYNFRYNVIMKQLEYTMLPEDDQQKKMNKVELVYRDFDDRDFVSLLIELKRSNYMIGKEGLKDLLRSRDMSKDFDPFADYLLNLSIWDERTDHIKKFLQQVQLINEEGNREDFIEAFKKWLTAMVASLLNDDIVNQWIFVLVGKQGIFKTTFLNNLIPRKYRMDYLFSSPFNFENKDHFKYLFMKWLINLDELARFNRTDENILKTILSEPRPAVRLPYAEYDMKAYRKASFAGSTNSKNFLKDETGSRRFLVFEVENIIFDEDFDIDLIYSQANGLYKNGFKYWFDRTDDDKIESRNIDFHNTSIEEDLIITFLQKPSNIELRTGTGFKWLTPTQINIELVTKSNSRVNVNETTKQRVGLILSKLGYEQKRMRVNGKTARVWAVKILDQASIESLPGSKELFDSQNEDII